ncbi:hypothetical protein [Caballeronia cordobensis]|uniref:hypothetical protein n=1 Tax=Caballeronia cordobensis TaxID=1353886 RepID=UPI00158CE266
MKMTLAQIGFRFLVSPSRAKGEWHHRSAVAQLVAVGWTDCTDMSDVQFDEFMGVATA